MNVGLNPGPLYIIIHHNIITDIKYNHIIMNTLYYLYSVTYREFSTCEVHDFGQPPPNYHDSPGGYLPNHHDSSFPTTITHHGGAFPHDESSFPTIMTYPSQPSWGYLPNHHESWVYPFYVLPASPQPARVRLEGARGLFKEWPGRRLN